MTRAEYIDAVKVKLEEISPFEEPETFIAAGDDSSIKVKPIKSYIDKSLDEATKHCLWTLPVTLLHADIKKTTPTVTIDSGTHVGKFPIGPNQRFVRFRHPKLERDITAFISTEDSLYLIQQNKHVQAGKCRPVAVISSDIDDTVTPPQGIMQIYTFPNDATTGNTGVALLSINTAKTIDGTGDNGVKSPIEEYIVLECAAIVAGIIGDFEAMKLCRQEIQDKLSAQLQ